MSEGEFSVCQFFLDGQYEYVRRYVDAKTAVEAFKFYTTNVASKVGITKRVIITDGGDYTCMEWKEGEGITFPPGLKGIIMVDINNPEELHDTIADAVGEPEAKLKK